MMYGRVKKFVAIALLLVIFSVPVFLIGETSRNPTAKLTELPWKGFLFVMVAGSIGGPILGFTIIRLLYWVFPDMADLAGDREDPSQTKEFLDWAVTKGIDPPRPEDLAKMKVTSVAGLWMEKMPEEVHLTMDGRDGDPVHYTRTDIAERIERRCYSSAARYWVGGGEVGRELFALAKLACGGTRPAVDWFNRDVPELEGAPTDFLNRGGDPQVLEKLLGWMAGTTYSPGSN